MSLNFKIQDFEGPLDLLLHLIKKAEVDIYNIPISEITDQYIEYIKGMQEFDMDIASEFIVMAATLLEIKSRMLLPKVKIKDGEDEGEDPRAELVEKLVEYKRYKEFASGLKEIACSNTIYFKEPEIIDDIEDSEVFFKNITMENLMYAFRDIIKSFSDRFNKEAVIPENIDFDEYRIEDKISFVNETVKKYGKVSFNMFFEKSRSIMEVVVTFMALLELIRLRNIRARQIENFGEIFIEGWDKA